MKIGVSDADSLHKNTVSYNNSDNARTAIYQLDPDQVTGDLLAVLDYAKSAPSSNGKVAVAGFCWGGTQTFRFATNTTEIQTALVFYGSSPTEQADIDRIEAPVYGFYGGNDQRINDGIAATEKLMSEAGKKYDYVIYPGAGHAYMRRGDDPAVNDENKTARDASWERLLTILGGIQ
jgi:carboxymethylenebutenolidase